MIFFVDVSLFKSAKNCIVKQLQLVSFYVFHGDYHSMALWEPSVPIRIEYVHAADH